MCSPSTGHVALLPERLNPTPSRLSVHSGHLLISVPTQPRQRGQLVLLILPSPRDGGEKRGTDRFSCSLMIQNHEVPDVPGPEGRAGGIQPIRTIDREEPAKEWG